MSYELDSHTSVRSLSGRVRHFVTATQPYRGLDDRRPDIDVALNPLLRLNDEEAGELLLVRHAQPDDRESTRQEFGSERPLGSDGHRQAEALAAALHCRGWVDAVYSAPELSARETADTIAAALDRPVINVKDLRDIDYVPVCGVSYECDTLATRFGARPRWDALPGFEGTRDFRRRVVQTIEAIIARHGGRRVVVVTHASLINAYLSMVLDIPRDLFFAPDFASISAVRYHDDLYAVRTLNDTTHLACAS